MHTRNVPMWLRGGVIVLFVIGFLFLVAGITNVVWPGRGEWGRWGNFWGLVTILYIPLNWVIGDRLEMLGGLAVLVAVAFYFTIGCVIGLIAGWIRAKV